MIKPFNFGRKKLFETTLHLTKFVADSRRVFHKRSFWRPRRLVQNYFCLYLWFCLQIRSKVTTNCTDDQIKSLTRTNLILRKLICQTPTNRSEEQCVVQFDTLFVHSSTGVVSCRQKLSSRNQGFNRAPGSWKSHFGIGSRSENSMNGMTPPLYPFPLAFQPINESSCRPQSPQPKPGVFASPCWWRRKWRLPVIS